MYQVLYYTDKNGKNPVKDYLEKLASENSKDSRIKASKIYACITHLEKFGPNAKEPHAKHLKNNIWELRPLRNRILYAAWTNNRFVLLHIFMKDTQKTPRREIEQAERNLTDFVERSTYDE